MTQDDYSIEVSQRQLALIGIPFLALGIGLGFVGGAFQTQSNYKSTYEGFIDNEHYEQEMVQEAIDAYNMSLQEFNENDTEAAFQLYRDGTKMTWALRTSHDEGLYGQFHKYAWNNCLIRKSMNKTGYLQNCEQSAEGLLKNLKSLEKYKFGNKTQTENKEVKTGGGAKA